MSCIPGARKLPRGSVSHGRRSSARRVTTSPYRSRTRHSSAATPGPTISPTTPKPRSVTRIPTCSEGFAASSFMAQPTAVAFGGFVASARIQTGNTPDVQWATSRSSPPESPGNRFKRVKPQGVCVQWLHVAAPGQSDPGLYGSSEFAANRPEEPARLIRGWFPVLEDEPEKQNAWGLPSDMNSEKLLRGKSAALFQRASLG